MRSSPAHLAAALSFAALATTAATTTVSAQSGAAAGAVIVRGTPAVGYAITANHREIPVATARDLIATHHPDVVDGTVDPASVTILLDANNSYVASAATKLAVIARASDGTTPTATAVAGFVSGVGVRAEAGSATASPRSTSMNLAGIGEIDASLVDEMFFTTYPAGEIAPSAVRVRFVILKPTGK